MLRRWLSVAMGLVLLPAWAAERMFDFSAFPPDSTPAGFQSIVSGEGKPGTWKIISAEVPTLIPPLTPQAAANKQYVLAQTAQDPADEHFPLLIFNEESFGDFTLSTRFKMVSGKVEQMAGLAFRIQDENNYYVVRASALGNSFRFYKFVKGQRTPPIGPEVSIPAGTWHEMSVECKGNQIRLLLNGKELIPPLTDNSFATGKIGFWTKSDAVSYFLDAKITYVPLENFAQVLVRDMMQRYPRLLGLKIYAPKAQNSKEMELIASNDPKEVTSGSAEVEQEVVANVINKGSVYQAKSDKVTAVTVPLHDRNGETVAALKVLLKPFPGQTEANALARALPINKEMEQRIQSAKGLRE